MSVTRREFLGYAAASVAARTLPRWPSAGLEAFDEGAVILDEHCTIPESSAGYEAALRAPECNRARILVAPAVMHLSKASLRAVHDRLDRGGTVILESGALFASESSGAVRSHRAMLRDEFDILVGAPVALWPARSTPYTRYIWPCSAMVRDYSRVIPLTADRARVIAVLDDMPVAVARALGRGTLIVLGSPLGPSLRFGDPAARTWLSHVVRRSITSARVPV